jgi:hypothetical protein
MNTKLENLKIYRDILIDIKYLYDLYNYNIRKKAEEYLSNQVNEKYNLYYDETKKHNKVKVLSLYR